MKLRAYQSDAVKLTYDSVREHQSCILQMPTGSGKTHVAMSVIKHGLQHNRRISFLVDRLTLVDQTLDKFRASGIRCGVMQGNHPDYNPAAPVQIVSIQTLRRRPEHLWPKSDLFIVDEAHSQYQAVYDLMVARPNSKFIGLSATPFSTGLGLHWQDLVVATTTADLIEQGYLCAYTAYGPSAPNMAGARIYGGEWAAEDAAERMQPLTGDIVAHYQSMAPGKKAIVFAANVAHAKVLTREFNRNGVSADYVSGKDNDERRRDVLNRFSNGEIKVLCNCEVLTKGYDQPDIAVAIIARPTRSLAMHIQMLGRVLRTHESKEKALILDHAGNIERLGFPDDPLPTVLCDKEKGVSTRDKREANDPLPWNCAGCHHLNPVEAHVCVACGLKPERPAANIPEQEDGVLTALRRENRADKQTVWAMLNHCRKEKGYQMGWVYHSYKALFGVGPNNQIDQRLTMRPSREMRKWVDERLAVQRKHFYAKKRGQERAAAR